MIAEIRENDTAQQNENKYVHQLYQNHKHVILNSSQYGDDRPLSCIRYSPKRYICIKI